MKIYLTLLAGLFHLFIFGQTFKVKKYLEKQGLQNRFVSAIEQDEMGFLWIGTGDGIYRFDGFEFTNAAPYLEQVSVTASYHSSANDIWFGLGDGRLFRLQNQQVDAIVYGASQPSKINQIIVSATGTLYILSQDQGIFSIDTNGQKKHYHSGLEEFTLYCLYPLTEDQLLVGTDMGLIHVHLSNAGNCTYDWNETIIETKVSCIHHLDGTLIIGTDDQGIYSYHITDGSIQNLASSTGDLSRYQINAIHPENANNWSLATNNAGLIGIHKDDQTSLLSIQTYGHETDVNMRSLRTAFVDREGNIWLGTYGQGLIMIQDKAMCIHQASGTLGTNEYQAIHEFNDQLFLASTNVLKICDRTPQQVIKEITIGTNPDNTITSLFADRNDRLWIGTELDGLWQYSLSTGNLKKFKLSEDILNNQVNDLTGFDDHLYVATEYGIFHIHNNVLLQNVISMQSGLAHNAVRNMHRDAKGRIWLASTHNEVTYIADGVIQNIATPFNGALVEVTCFAEDQNGHIWAGTDGNGVFSLTRDEPIIFTKNDGLHSDHCYGMLVDHYNRLWVTHRGALSRLDLNNHKIQIVDPITDADILFAYNAVECSKTGKVFFASDKGLIEYDLNKDNNLEFEPILNVNRLLINDSLYQSNAIALAHGTYQIELQVIGISLSDPKGVLYQYFLEGYDSDWSAPTTDRKMIYNKITEGKYNLRVRCFTAKGFGGSKEISFQIEIAIPFWKTWWFICCSILIAIASVFIIINYRERALRQAKIKLQSLLDIRTREVVQQKELLEISNKDITDSIRYAKNIQQAMLPSHSLLKNQFADAFIYFKPRDIVSGDFYTIERFEDIIVVSCADCTGHGVPGAFMSLIGSTILKEVSKDKNVQHAGQALMKLDHRLREMLTREGTTTVSDGMDITLFDYNTSTRMLQIASANRSTFLYHKGEWIEIKGDRRNVGGQGLSSFEDFNIHQYVMEPGDCIYMFSDGITDQFGGPHGKKIKRSRLLEWLKSSQNHPMSEQREIIKSNFHNWKGTYEQTDDVIIMGIRF
jgi:ligand-binding sensor domain-containing protein/serine phosphatase RsbU (regulator of sigma subunit)